MKRERTVAVLAMLLVWLAFVFPVLAGQVRFPVDFAGPSPPGSTGPHTLANAELGDAYFAMYTWHEYLGARLRSGDVPLWDPHRFAGTPFAADIGVGTWYPPNWLYASGRPLVTFTLVSILSSLAALLVTYWFLRVIELHPYAAALGAITFSFSAFLVKWATNETVMASALWIALPLGGLEVARRGRRWRGTVLAAVGLALVTVGGHAQVALYVWVAALLWAAVALLAQAVQGRRLRPVLVAAVPVVAASALAVGLSAVQLLPTAELSGEIVRQRTTWEVARTTFLPFEHLATVVLPDYLGNPVDRNYAGPGVNYTETMLYAGLLTLPLAAVGLLHRFRRATWFFAVLVAGGFLAVFGSPLYRVILAMPGFSRTLFATRFILFIDFGLAVLAALGLDHLLRGAPSPRRVLPLLAGSTLAVAGVVWWLTLERPGTSLPGSYLVGRGGRALLIVAVGGVALAAMVKVPAQAGRMALVVLAVAGADLWLTGFRFNPFQDPRPVYRAEPGTDALAAAPGARPRFAEVGRSFQLAPNAAVPLRLYGLGGYDPLIPRAVVELVGVAEDQRARARTNFFGPFKPSTARSPVFDLLGVTRLVGPATARVGGPPIFAGRFGVFDRPTAFPAAFVTSCWEVVPPAEVLQRVSRMSSSELRATAVVGAGSTTRRALGSSPPNGCASAGTTTVERYEPERVSLRARTDRAGVLVLSDTWFPGWEATVDGEAVPVLEVNHALRGVALGPGDHRVEFRFRPASFRIGAAVSAASVVVLCGAALWRWDRRRRDISRRPRLRPRRDEEAPAASPDGRPSSPVPPRDRPPAG